MSARRLLAVLALVVAAVGLIAYGIIRTPAITARPGITVGDDGRPVSATSGASDGGGASDAGGASDSGGASGAGAASDGGGAVSGDADGGADPGQFETGPGYTATPIPSPSHIPTHTVTPRPPSQPKDTGPTKAPRTTTPPRDSSGVCEWDDEDGEWDCDDDDNHHDIGDDDDDDDDDADD